MIENPELYVEQFLDAGTEMISFHIEAVKHPNRLLKAIRSYNAAACIAVNPATSMDFLPYVIDNIDAILIMTVDPGFAGQKYIPAVIDKIRKTRDYLDMIGKKILIEVDGNISYEVSPKVINAGADILVVGTSSIFTGKDELIKNFQKYRNFLDQIINKSNVEQEVS
jgi:ribulose-phosphate 3-epimerase